MKKIFIKARTLVGLMVFGGISLANASTDLSAGCQIAGSASAALKIEEFVDFECSYCAKGSAVMKEILKNYPGKVNLVLRNNPLPGHTNSAIAAKAFLAVYLQDPSLASSFQENLFENQARLIREGEPYLYEVAEKLGVNLTEMKTEMKGEAVARALAADQRRAKLFDFKGTPSFIIGSESVSGAQPYGEIKKVVDRQLEQQ